MPTDRYSDLENILEVMRGREPPRLVNLCLHSMGGTSGANCDPRPQSTNGPGFYDPYRVQTKGSLSKEKRVHRGWGQDDVHRGLRFANADPRS